MPPWRCRVALIPLREVYSTVWELLSEIPNLDSANRYARPSDCLDGERTCPAWREVFLADQVNQGSLLDFTCLHSPVIVEYAEVAAQVSGLSAEDRTIPAQVVEKCAHCHLPKFQQLTAEIGTSLSVRQRMKCEALRRFTPRTHGLGPTGNSPSGWLKKAYATVCGLQRVVNIRIADRRTHPPLLRVKAICSCVDAGSKVDTLMT